jgi:hypothetical protein
MNLSTKKFQRFNKNKDSLNFIERAGDLFRKTNRPLALYLPGIKTILSIFLIQTDETLNNFQWLEQLFGRVYHIIFSLNLSVCMTQYKTEKFKLINFYCKLKRIFTRRLCL